VLESTGAPVLQVVFAGGDEAGWRGGSQQGLMARDIAMNVALPEVDGRIMSRAVSFKGAARTTRLSRPTSSPTQPDPDRVAFVAELAARWARLRRTAAGRTPCGRSCWPTTPTATAASPMVSGLIRPAGTVRCCGPCEAAGYATG
jgi:cobaltochelatase CobN